VIRSCNLDGSGYRQNYLMDKVTNESVSANLTDLVIHFTMNNTMFVIDSTRPTKMISINLDAPISWLNETFNEPLLFEYFTSPRLMNTTSEYGGLEVPRYLNIDEYNHYLLWTEPTLNQVRFARYIDIWDDIEGNGIAFNGHLRNPNGDDTNPYQYQPIAMLFDRGLGRPRWGQTVDCYGNGLCQGMEGNFVCECHNGFSGDCQTVSCPKGKAWYEEPAVNNIAHDSYVDCSNMGVCDYTTGTCQCRYGFEGPACERASCIGDSTQGAVCYNKGRCRSLKELGQHHKDHTGSPDPVYYGYIPNTPETWDAEMIYGCLPDEYGWMPDAQYNISTITSNHAIEYSCPAGHIRRLMDDVYANHLNYSTVFNIQSIVCSAYKGYFQFEFRGQTTQRIYANSTETQLKNALQELPGIGAVDVQMSHAILCSDQDTYYAAVTFLSQFGDLPLLKVVNHNLKGFTNTVTVTALRTGTVDSVAECSGHGECDRSLGQCKCWEGYGPSDGVGNAGTHGDCGYLVV
jgi:hypothetical protein